MVFLGKFRKLTAWTLCRCLILLGIGFVALSSCDHKTRETQAGNPDVVKLDSAATLTDSSNSTAAYDTGTVPVTRSLKPEYNPEPIQPTGYGAMPAYKTELPEKN
ncbi:hypothetical protein SDC9_73275 [bioreactor metagenome]|uniref:Uncharacterized protein n=1 Tax=bioreactor metagenome TaxID=1076179 RepID=A0A644YEA1_9ZZZZ